MTIEADIVSALTSLVGGRVYPDVAPNNPTLPFITYQQVGGDAPVFLEATVPSKRNGRFQVNVWATTRAQAASLALSIESALVTTLKATPSAAPTALHEQEFEPPLYGARQDFSIWFAP